jgi:hypothetical protein
MLYLLAFAESTLDLQDSSTAANHHVDLTTVGNPVDLVSQPFGSWYLQTKAEVFAGD